MIFGVKKHKTARWLFDFGNAVERRNKTIELLFYVTADILQKPRNLATRKLLLRVCVLCSRFLGLSLPLKTNIEAKKAIEEFGCLVRKTRNLREAKKANSGKHKKHSQKQAVASELCCFGCLVLSRICLGCVALPQNNNKTMNVLVFIPKSKEPEGKPKTPK